MNFPCTLISAKRMEEGIQDAAHGTHDLDSAFAGMTNSLCLLTLRLHPIPRLRESRAVHVAIHRQRQS